MKPGEWFRKSLLYDDILYQYVTMHVSETPFIVVHAVFLLLGLIKITINSTPKHVKKPTINYENIKPEPYFFCSVI